MVTGHVRTCMEGTVCERGRQCWVSECVKRLMDKKSGMNVLVIKSTQYVDIRASPAKSWAPPYVQPLHLLARVALLFMLYSHTYPYLEFKFITELQKKGLE